MKFFLATRLALATLLLGAVPAGAATITVNDAPWTDPGLIQVDFSRFQVCGQTGDLDTEGGRFRAVGLPGQKGTVCGDASRAQVRKATTEYIELSGRHGAEYWLDSNDVPSIEFKLRSRKVQFLTSDLADVYGYFRLEAGNASYEINTKQKAEGFGSSPWSSTRARSGASA